MKGKTRSFLYGILILLSSLLTYQAHGIMLIPEKHSVAVGEPLKINFPASIEKTLKTQILDKDSILFFTDNYDQNSQVALFQETGQVHVKLSLFGIIPVKDMLVSIVPQVKVIPGGQSIGVLLHSQGVIVVGCSGVLDESGNVVRPAGDAGVMEGDIILKIDGEAIRSDIQVRDLVARAGSLDQSLTIEIKRGSEIFTALVKPVYCKDSLRYRVGLMVKDTAAGVGTLTFYEPQTLVYGALGHLITDMSTNRPVELSDGKIIDANVQGIHRGRRGQPGEKIGVFLGDKRINGTITNNTKVGIFGYLQKPIDNPIFSKPLPVAMIDQIKEGPAEILTVLKDDKVERFQIEIIKINPLARQDGKGIVIRITDPRLLEVTGGIVQGMSGSPIIQDNKLVGAVTHVFVNDPTRGYGVPLEWMAEESGLLKSSEQYAKKTAA